MFMPCISEAVTSLISDGETDLCLPRFGPHRSGEKEIVYLGMPAGLLLTLGGKTIYHAGDTCLFPI